ncbi:hypothetical protein LRR18_09415 [Mangrovimonas sp. AS39]|uniref:hypothetical protein n=1 Tax=Mangrovimonas futianensis TaxID=2895523 RepID=UPI001E3A2972|nr:hypothetical protein [Mangrovimonas futianensis]MCF1191804.1 hypothetical protein [Mangrovimonas futianensis]MCF1195308.1 hypothetical protein [Mangrovimonas futianensis]
MKVFGKCQSCQSEIPFITQAYTRVEFAMRIGEFVTLKCKSCKTETKFHVDELFANPSKLAQISSGLVLLIGTPLIFLVVNPFLKTGTSHYLIYSVGGFLLIPVFIYAILNRQDQNRVSNFNRRKLKGRIHNIGS